MSLKKSPLRHLTHKLLARASALRPALMFTSLGLITSQAEGAFTIDLDFSPTTTAQQQVAFTQAKHYWEALIVGYKPGVNLTGLTISANVTAIDGIFGILGQASPTNTSRQNGTTYAISGAMQFDSADVVNMIAEDSFAGVIRHEMGHVLGIGTLWKDSPGFAGGGGFPPVNAWEGNDLYVDGTGAYFNQLNPTATTAALMAWRIEFGQDAATFMPIELEGGGGTANGHWNESVFGAGLTGIKSKFAGLDFRYELMTGWANEPLFTSNVTLGGLVDLGYVMRSPDAVAGVYREADLFINPNLAGEINPPELPKGMVWGVLSGANSFNKNLDETVALMGANTYTGGTVISAGTLIAGNVSALGSGSLLIDGGVLDVFDTHLAGVGALTLRTGSIVQRTGSLSASSYAVESGTIAASLRGVGALTKTTSGTVTLSGDNLYSGGTFVQAGRLVVANEGALGTGILNVTGGTLDLGSTVVLPLGIVTVDGGEIVASGGSLQGSVYDLRSGKVSATLRGDGVSAVKSTSGTLELSGANTYTGGTVVNDGVLKASHASALSAGDVTVNAGELSVGSTAVSGVGVLTLNGGAITGTTGSLSASSVILNAGSVSAGLAGPGAVTKQTGSSVTLSGDNSFTGGLTVAAGTVVGAGANSLGAGPVNFTAGGIQIAHTDAAAKATMTLSGGALAFAGVSSAKFGGIAGTANLDLVNDAAGRLDLTVGGNNVSTVYKGVLSGAGSLTKIGAGSLRLEKDSTFSGGVTVSAGLLDVARARALGTGDVLVNGGTLNIGSRNIVDIGRLTVDSGTVRGSGTIQATGFEVRSGTVSSRLVGAGALSKTGSGTATLSGVNTFTGGIDIVEGTLAVSRIQALSSGAVAVRAAGALEIIGNGEINDVTLTVAGAGSTVFSESGTTRLHGSWAPAGSLTVNTGHTLSLGAISGETVAVGASDTRILAGATLRGSGSFAGSLSNAGVIAPGFSPGTINVAGDFTNTGTLDMEIDSTGAHDRINFTGQAFLGGSLNVILLGAEPAQGTVVDFLVDTDTSDGRPSFAGSFSSVLIPPGTGVIFNTGGALRFIVGGGLADIPGSNIDPRLISFSRSITRGSPLDATLNLLANPTAFPASQINGVLRSASPLSLASLVALPLAQSHRDVAQLQRHLNACRYERPEMRTDDWSPYVEGNGMTVSNGNSSDGPAFDLRSFGGLVGLDKRVGDDLTVGVQVSYDNGRADFHSGAGRVEQNHGRLTAYVSNLVSNRFFVDAGVFGGLSLYESKRQNFLGTFEGDTNGWDFGGFVNSGFIMPVTSELSLTPHLGFSYSNQRAAGFTENGGPLGLAVSSVVHDSLALRAGSGASWLTHVAGAPVRVGLDASYVRELSGNETDLAADFFGVPTGGFVTEAVVSPRHRLEVGPELDVGIGEGRSITASYKFEYAFGDATGHRFDVGYRSRF